MKIIMNKSLPFSQSDPNISNNYNQALAISKIITKKPLYPYLAPKPLFNLSLHAPKILQLPPNFTTPFPVVFRSTPFKNPSKNIFPSLFLYFLRFELNDKACVSFLDCVLVCVRRRSRSDRGRTRRWAVPRASVRPRTRRTVPWSGPPGRLWRRQVQSHPLMHILSQFYKHNLLAYFKNCILLYC